MSITLYQKPYPVCPHLRGENPKCNLLSDLIHREVEVSSSFCNLICKSRQSLENPEKLEQMKKVVAQNWMVDREALIERKRKEFAEDKRPIGVPQWWGDARRELESVYASSAVQSVRLTGSAIYSDKMPTKDVDLIVYVRSFSDVPSIVLPKTLVGLKTDVFFATGWYGIWPQLDCETKTLHLPKDYPIEGRQIEAGITIEMHDDPPFVLTTTAAPPTIKPKAEVTPAKPPCRQCGERVSGEAEKIRAAQTSTRKGCGCGRKG